MRSVHLLLFAILNVLPFDLTPESSSQVEVQTRRAGGKTGAGFEEWTVFGDGRVRWRRTAHYKAKLEEKTGQVGSQRVLELLRVLEEGHVLGLDDKYAPPPVSNWLTWTLTLTLPGKTKTTRIENPEVLQTQRFLFQAVEATVQDGLNGSTPGN